MRNQARFTTYSLLLPSLNFKLVCFPAAIHQMRVSVDNKVLVLFMCKTRDVVPNWRSGSFKISLSVYSIFKLGLCQPAEPLKAMLCLLNLTRKHKVFHRRVSVLDYSSWNRWNCISQNRTKQRTCAYSTRRAVVADLYRIRSFAFRSEQKRQGAWNPLNAAVCYDVELCSRSSDRQGSAPSF